MTALTWTRLASTSNVQNLPPSACVYEEWTAWPPTISPDYPLRHTRLKSLFVRATPRDLQDITTRLFHPAPLLNPPSIDGGYKSEPKHRAVLTTTLFDGDPSSLRALHLQSVRTGLPWGNMAKLTTFMMFYTPPGHPPIGQLLGFFENTPHLREIRLHLTTPTSDTQGDRLVPVARLKRVDITGNNPSSLLLNHPLISVGAKLTTAVPFRGPLIKDHLPRSFDGLKNLSTKINTRIGGSCPFIRFSGQNGQLTAIPIAPLFDITRLVLEALARFDTSSAQRLDIERGNTPSGDPLYQALLPMKTYVSSPLLDAKPIRLGACFEPQRGLIGGCGLSKIGGTHFRSPSRQGIRS